MRFSSATTPAAIPSDAPVIMHGIEEELGRPVYGMADFFFRTVPWVGHHLVTYRGRPRAPRQRPPAPSRPGPARARLPRRNEGTVQDLQGQVPAAAIRSRRVRRDRDARRGPGRADRLHRCRGVDADRLPAPSVAKALGVPYMPVTANMLLLGPLGVLGYFPSKFKLRVLDPVRFDMPSGQERYSKSRIMDEAESIRTHMQETIYDMLRDRRSVWFG